MSHNTLLQAIEAFGDTYAGVPTIANLFGLKANTLRKRLTRWADRTDAHVIYDKEPRMRQPSVYFNLRAAADVLREMIAEQAADQAGQVEG